jgi:glutamate synthase domain-containing protein 2
MPLMDGLAFAENMLIGFGIRKHIKLIASGKVLTGFAMVKTMALGADMCNSARAMMMALGCIQALKCNTNQCPTGVATQDPELVKGLSVSHKKTRVANFHNNTVESFVELIAAAGIDHPRKLNRGHVHRRVFMNDVRSFDEIYPYIPEGSMLNGTVPERYKAAFAASAADRF